MTKTIRIGGASGYWGESMMASPQLLQVEGMDYLVYDFLAEITMSILARARAAKPEMGYATDFISGVLKPNLREIADKKVKILTNAGGVNPEACGAAARALIKEAGLDLKVAVVTGDDLLDRAQDFAAMQDMFSGADCPDPASLASVNAYLGGFPVAKALDGGADIVITGRSVDSAVTLGACIHAFGWQPQDLDALAGGSLAGHIIECGPQASGGNFTDWELSGDIAEIGYPFIDIDGDGVFTVMKPEGTSGVVNVGTVSEQMLYEIGDPQAYLLPDVTCDFSEVTIEQAGDNQVRVAQAKGHTPPTHYKVCATYADGFRAGTLMSFVGLQAAAKAKSFAEAAFVRARNVLRQHNLADYSETSIEVIGDDSQFGEATSNPHAREVVLKIAAKHETQAGAGALLKEISGLGLATPAGLSIFAGSRAKPSPVVRLFSFLLPKADLSIGLDVDGQKQSFEEAAVSGGDAPATPPVPDAPPEKGAVDVPLVKLAWGRSGDKGNKANIGIIARDAAYLPYIWAALDEDAIRHRFGHFIGDNPKLARFYLPGSHAMNILIEDALGGGGVASLRNDPQGKAYAQVLLDHPIPIPAELAERL
ncbi:MAG: acyclic terpene utilization AtuA family protein [Alphaproteobacteria bacterium]|nr:acyclic terpene utilization AtuA family protein [Alphaproteobacteria bacterium]